MKLIVISPESGNNEIQQLIELFGEGLEYFHLRKPQFNEEEMKHYLFNIPPEYYSNIVLHSYHHLVESFRLKGIHYPEKDRLSTEYINTQVQISSSFHNLDDLINCSIHYDYVFISPVFNSISKQGYQSRFQKEDFKKTLPLIHQTIIALGGVDENNFHELLEMGFDGAALLGAVWNHKNPVEKFKGIRKLVEEK